MSKIHHDITLPASPDKVFSALMDTDQHAAFTGAPASVGGVGEPFSAYGGKVAGLTVEAIPGERIIQAWRIGDWPEGVYSLVRFDLSADGSGTRLSFDHTGIPDGAREHLDGGWHKMYWEPMTKYLAG